MKHVQPGAEGEQRRKQMARTFECTDLGAECPGRFTTPNDEELWKHVELHIREAHAGLEITREFTDKLRSVFKDSADAPVGRG